MQAATTTVAYDSGIVPFAKMLIESKKSTVLDFDGYVDTNMWLDSASTINFLSELSSSTVGYVRL